VVSFRPQEFDPILYLRDFQTGSNMSDPLSTGAGIVGVLSLVIQITQTVAQFGIDWRDAPDSVRAFIYELGTLKTVL
jgi:hypothetical protein